MAPAVPAAQVKYQAVQQYHEVAAAQAAARPKQAEADRMFRRVIARPGGARCEGARQNAAQLSTAQHGIRASQASLGGTGVLSPPLSVQL